MTSVAVDAPAKLTVDLRVTGVRPDGYHLLDSEMVTLDLADTLVIGDGDGLEVVAEWPVPGDGSWRPLELSAGPDNLVVRALAATGRRADVRLVKRIPPGAGLGGGSADAAAVLRWAGVTDPAVAAGLGADVPFCVRGGRARVRGIGEEVAPLPHVDRRFLLLLPPFGVDTAAVYRAWDRLSGGGGPGGHHPSGNDLLPAALVVEPRLAPWARALEGLTGRPARLAGSGSTWFVEEPPVDAPDAGPRWLEVGGVRGALVPARSRRGAAVDREGENREG